MMTPIPLVALSLALAGEGHPPAASTAAESATSDRPAATAPRDPDRPPPGSPADQALWQAAFEVNSQLVVEQYVAARLAHGAKGSGYLERLPELAKAGALPSARADELARRLRQSWTANLELVQSQWPVSKVRVCTYELLHFEAVMGEGPARAAQLADMRTELQRCLGRADLVMRPLRKANEALQAALSAVERELASLPNGPGPSAPARPD